MPKLEHLRTDFLLMPEREARDFVNAIRADRRVYKEHSATRKAKAKRKVELTTALRKLAKENPALIEEMARMA